MLQTDHLGTPESAILLDFVRTMILHRGPILSPGGPLRIAPDHLDTFKVVDCFVGIIFYSA